jgi:hypothetical protein
VAYATLAGDVVMSATLAGDMAMYAMLAGDVAVCDVAISAMLVGDVAMFAMLAADVANATCQRSNGPHVTVESTLSGPRTESAHVGIGLFKHA